MSMTVLITHIRRIRMFYLVFTISTNVNKDLSNQIIDINICKSFKSLEEQKQNCLYWTMFQNLTRPTHTDMNPRALSVTNRFFTWFCDDLTKTVMAIMCQIESVITSAAIVSWYIVAFMNTTTIVVQVTFINVCGVKSNKSMLKYRPER